MVTYYSKLLHATWLGLAMSGDVPWLWPLFETLHFFGMVLLIGCVVVLDLRILGVGKGLPLRPLRKLIPWGILGFAINLVTGIGFYAGFPGQYQNWAFFWKMTFVVMAGINALLFYTTGLYRRVKPIGAGQNVPMAGKLAAAISLFLWFGVMFWGRLLQAFSDSF